MRASPRGLPIRCLERAGQLSAYVRCLHHSWLLIERCHDLVVSSWLYQNGLGYGGAAAALGIYSRSHGR